MFKWKKIEIKANQVALVFKQGALEEILPAGTHRISFNRDVVINDMAKPFTPGVNMDYILKDSRIVDMLDIIEVKDHQIALQYKNEIFHTVMSPGRYIYWKGGTAFTYHYVDLEQLEVDNSINKKVLSRPMLSAYIRKFEVMSYEKGLLYIDGALQKEVSAGIYNFWKNSKKIEILKVDMRTQQMDVAGQELLTKDKASIRINLSAQYEVVDIYKAIAESKDYTKQLYVMIQLAIREYVGQYSLDELLLNKTQANTFIMDSVSASAKSLGIKLLHAGIKDIILPGDVKSIMNQVLIAEKKAQANVIMRREETASTRSLMNTAKLMQDNEMLYKLKEMEYVEKIAENIQGITLSGGSQIVDQLKTIFAGSK